ncbi:hypothetical protein AB1L42_21235 [Thalassoglobus sp. JC818]|uniref:hypothetical protein n=1 Tax=Thalassoglobus sp. JC818 TaxID=3232136 RepID=UPI00345B04B3
MQKLPYRTNTTSLSDDDLILLDVLFNGFVPFSMLCSDAFQFQGLLGYTHNLNDDELRCRLRRLVEHRVLEIKRDGNRTSFGMTAYGGELWSQERCPIWDRYCRDYDSTGSEIRTMMSVVAVSPQIRDDFLRLYPLYPTRVRTATISNHVLVPWITFPKLHVGIMTYVEETERTAEEYAVYSDRLRRHHAALERERSWWRSVSELQRFIPNAS